jgi:hypothetical protein
MEEFKLYTPDAYNESTRLEHDPEEKNMWFQPWMDEQAATMEATVLF